MFKHVKCILVCSLLTTSIAIHACDCKESTRNLPTSEFAELFDWIFLAEIKENKDGFHSIIVKEVFKGTIQSDIKINNNNSSSCDYKVQTGETWLIYTNATNDHFTVYGCSKSREINQFRYNIPPPPPPAHSDDTAYYDNLVSEYEKSDKGDVMIEIAELRKIK